MNREERLAENEILFRDVNEKIRELEQGWQAHEVGFMCECADSGCTSVMTLTLEEYERLRTDPIWFAVLPGHQVADIEDVVEAHAGYLVVEKHAETHERVREADPRSD